MATLLERIKQGLGQATTPTAPEAGTQTGQLEALLSAKAGITGPRKGLKGQSLTEAAAQQQTQQQLSGLSQQAALGQTAVEQAAQEQAQRQSQQEQQIEQQRQEGTLRTRIQTENILQDLEQRKAGLSEEKRQSRMEQAGLLLRTQSKDYTDRLRLNGAQSRLQDAIKFNEELAKTLIGENQALLEQGLKNQAALDAKGRDFETMLAKMEVNDILNAYRQESQQAQKQAIIGGITETARTGASMYGQGQFSSEYRDYVNNLGPEERPMSYAQFEAKKRKSAQSSTSTSTKE